MSAAAVKQRQASGVYSRACSRTATPNGLKGGFENPPVPKPSRCDIGSHSPAPKQRGGLGPSPGLRRMKPVLHSEAPLTRSSSSRATRAFSTPDLPYTERRNNTSIGGFVSSRSTSRESSRNCVGNTARSGSTSRKPSIGFVRNQSQPPAFPSGANSVVLPPAESKALPIANSLSLRGGAHTLPRSVSPGMTRSKSAIPLDAKLCGASAYLTSTMMQSSSLKSFGNLPKSFDLFHKPDREKSPSDKTRERRRMFGVGSATQGRHSTRQICSMCKQERKYGEACSTCAERQSVADAVWSTDGIRQSGFKTAAIEAEVLSSQSSDYLFPHAQTETSHISSRTTTASSAGTPPQSTRSTDVMTCSSNGEELQEATEINANCRLWRAALTDCTPAYASPVLSQQRSRRASQRTGRSNDA